TARETAARAQELAAAHPASAPGDIDALRAQLATMQALKARTAALDAALAECGQAQAAARARRDERADGARLVAAQATAAQAMCVEVEGRAGAARDAYARAAYERLRLESPPDAATLAAAATKLDRQEQDAAGALGALGARLEAAERERAESAELALQQQAFARSAELAGALEQELHRNRFVAFVQREAMHALASEAGRHLEQLSRGRYRLRVQDDEFEVVDRLNGDEARSVKTLSGGETFLASLALALALAERLPELAGHGGAVSLESLFLDEGFGSLDADALDVALEGLELLAGGQRVIGVISHVPLVAERLADRFEVVRDGATSSVRALRGDLP
ncbi:MAG: hypothetical protein FJ035_01865, partial [Chloroflexi bacterium]|nr:hypothetical protein [Chloroflexota bacterium]